MPIPSDYLMLSGLCPESRQLTDFFLSREHLYKIELDGPAQKFYDSRLLEPVLTEPCAIFRGLKRPSFENGFCYSGKPAVRWIEGGEDGIEIASPFDQVFLVFVRPSKGYLVFDWEWRDEHPKQAGVPIHWERNFEALQWQPD